MIPKSIHFIAGMRDAELAYFQFLAIATCKSTMPDYTLALHVGSQIKGPWYDKAVPFVDRIVPIHPGDITAFGTTLRHPAHQSDIARLQILRREGGIYLDLDTIIFRRFDDLLPNRTVMARQGTRGLCNAFIMSQAQAPFLETWWSCYANFSDDDWDYHSVVLPGLLSRRVTASSDITVLPEEACFFPTWSNDLAELLTSSDPRPFSQSYMSHLWYGKCPDAIAGITPQFIRLSDCVYANTVRRRIPRSVLDTD